MLKLFSGSENPRSFLKQISILLNAGIPLGKALDCDTAFSDVAEKIRSGSSFCDALAASGLQGNIIATISVGERNGDLAGGVARACAQMERNESFRKKLVGSLIYPAFVLLLCVGAMIILTSVLLPSFTGIFNSLGASLPPLSRMIMEISGQWPLITVLAAVLFAAGIRYVMSDRGLKFPVIGNFRRKLIFAAFFRAMAESLGSGMNIIESLDLASSVVNSKIYKEKLISVSASVTEGQKLSAAFDSVGIFNKTVLSLVSAGEQASSLDKVFEQLARLYEEEIENNLKTFSSLVEPAATLATGLVVGIIVFAMFLPIIKLIGILGG